MKLSSIASALEQCFDVVFHQAFIGNQSVEMLFLSSLTNQMAITQLIEGFLFSQKQTRVFFNGSISAVEDEKKAYVLLLSGQCLVELEGQLYAIETRQYPTRSVHSPESEKSIRGSSDAFNENILTNVGLIRRRIKDERLQVQLKQEGKMSHTDICLIYMKELVDQQVLDDFENRLKNNQSIEIQNERNLVEALYGRTLNPYPHVRYTERPDICAIHLMQGSVVVLVDNMPSAMLLPTTFFEQLQQIEEYTQTPLIAFSTRLIRYSGIFASLYLFPYTIALVLSGKNTFFQLELNHLDPFLFSFQILFAELVVEWIRQSLIYSPLILSSMMGFIVVFVLGDFGIELGAYTKEILLFVAMCNLGNYLTPSYEISLANKFVRILLTIVTLFFGVSGFAIGLLLHFLLLIKTKTIKYPYLYPLVPFSWREMKRILFDTSIYTK